MTLGLDIDPAALGGAWHHLLLKSFEKSLLVRHSKHFCNIRLETNILFNQRVRKDK